METTRKLGLPAHWVNGSADEQLCADDRGIRYGDGLFETVRLRYGQPLLWRRHLQRLQLGCETLSIPFDEPRIQSEIENCAAQAGLDKVESAVLRLTVTRGTGSRGYRVTEVLDPTHVVSIYHADSWDVYRALHLGVCDTPATVQPALSGLKHLNRLDNVMAARELGESGCDEGLMCVADGRVVSGVMSNVFIVQSGNLLTPEIRDAGVAGTVRGLILDTIAAAAGMVVNQVDLTVDDVAAAEEIFMTNGVSGLQPVATFLGRNRTIWPHTLRLREVYLNYLRETVDA